MTSLIYNTYSSTTTLVMSQDPLVPREFEEDKTFVSAFDSLGSAYAYDCSSPIYRTESLIFPTIGLAELSSLVSFIGSTLDGAHNTFLWKDRFSISRTARYKNLNYIKISSELYKVTLTLEVLS